MKLQYLAKQHTRQRHTHRKPEPVLDISRRSHAA